MSGDRYRKYGATGLEIRLMQNVSPYLEEMLGDFNGSSSGRRLHGGKQVLPRSLDGQFDELILTPRKMMIDRSTRCAGRLEDCRKRYAFEPLCREKSHRAQHHSLSNII